MQKKLCAYIFAIHQKFNLAIIKLVAINLRKILAIFFTLIYIKKEEKEKKVMIDKTLRITNLKNKIIKI